MNTPLISVIVPIYNVQQYIHRCITSILSQSFKKFELILIDDGSPDNCGAICDDYAAKDSRVHVIHQENGGLSAARNAGIDWAFTNSDSEWISFVDSDDWINSEYLNTLFLAATNNCADIAICDNKVVNSFYYNEPFVSNVFLESHSCAYKKIFYNAGGSNYTPAWGKLISKELLCNIRFPVGRIYEDLFIMPKLFSTANRIVKVDYIGYYYFNNDKSITGTPYSLKHLDEIEATKNAINFLISIGETEAAIEGRRRLLKLLMSNQTSVLSELNLIDLSQKFSKEYRSLFSSMWIYLLHKRDIFLWKYRFPSLKTMFSFLSNIHLLYIKFKKEISTILRRFICPQ